MSTDTDAPPVISQNLEAAVIDRYAQGAEKVEPALCCPTSMADSELLAIVPDEIKNVDYGCGDPSQHCREGDVVIDLGSGSGKACYVMAQKVGAEGKVIGVDFNDSMLDLARRYQQEMADRIGYANTGFVKARIQDLALDIDKVDAWLADNPVTSTQDMLALEAWSDEQRRTQPLFAASTIDLIVSNCVLNLVATGQKKKLFAEMYRVLRDGGRAVISDIVCDAEPPESMKNDHELWSGCISGAFQEDEFSRMFFDAGFSSVVVLERAIEPWQVVDGIEFRSMTVRAVKGEGHEPEVDCIPVSGGCCDPGDGCC